MVHARCSLAHAPASTWGAQASKPPEVVRAERSGDGGICDEEMLTVITAYQVRVRGTLSHCVWGDGGRQAIYLLQR